MSSFNTNWCKEEETIGIDLDTFSIEEEVEKYKDIDLVSYNVLVRQYISAPKTKGGLIIPESTLRDEVYTSCVGLVVKKSPLAYDHPDFENRLGHWCEVGQWVVFSKTNVDSICFFGAPCFFVHEKGLLVRNLPDPRIAKKRTNLK